MDIIKNSEARGVQETINGEVKVGDWWGEAVLIPEEKFPAVLYFGAKKKQWFVVASEHRFYFKNEKDEWESDYFDPHRIVAEIEAWNG